MVVALEDTSILVFTTVSPVRKRILQAQLNGRPRLSDAEAQMPSARTSAATRTSAQRPLDFRLFPSATTSRDNCLWARSRALKRPVFADFSLKAPDC